MTHHDSIGSVQALNVSESPEGTNTEGNNNVLTVLNVLMVEVEVCGLKSGDF